MTDPLAILEGGGELPASFWELDMNNQLKLKSFVPLGMPFVFRNLHKTFNLFTMRKRGLVPIVYHMDFRSTLVPVAFGSQVQSRHEVKVCRHTPSEADAAAGKDRERLLEEIRIRFQGRRSMGDKTQLGYDERTGELEQLGTGRIVHVFTKPLAPPAERGVTELPPEMAHMQVHPWSEPYPTIDRLHEHPPGFAPCDAGRWARHDAVWGLPNTDINQHVNVVEYLMAGENHFTRMLHGARIDLARHQMTRLALIFRKPFFPGDAYAMQGQLLRENGSTLMTATVHRLERDGGLDEKPAVGIRCEGSITSA